MLNTHTCKPCANHMTLASHDYKPNIAIHLSISISTTPSTATHTTCVNSQHLNMQSQATHNMCKQPAFKHAISGYAQHV